MANLIHQPERYGINFPSELDQLQIELIMFRERVSEENGGLGRLGHYQNICKILWPDLVYTEWTNRMHEALCRPGSIIMTGPASAGKSWEMARFAIIWMIMAPTDIAVAVTSTSVQMSRKRIWAKLKTMWTTANDMAKANLGYCIPGHIMDSSTEIQAKKGDSEHAISIVPGSQKYLLDGVTKLKGWHAKYVLILADELQDMTDEVVHSCVNMRSGSVEFKFAGSGNGCSWMNTMGKSMMPLSGNPESVTVDMDEWEAKDATVIHFDGLKSPNIIDPGSAPWNQSQSDVDKIIETHGENSLQYWQMVRGFPPPDDSYNAVVSESLLIKFQALQDQELATGWEWHAGLDSGFGGDDCVLKLAKVGTFILPQGETLRQGVVFSERIVIKTVAKTTDPIDFQIANQAIAICKQRGIKPRNFSIDGTGTGRGVAAIIRKEWFNDIHVLVYGESASDLPVSAQDYTKCKDAYFNCVTEMYYSFRIFVMNGQVRGVTAQMARGFGCRTYSVRNGRTLLSPKLEAKKILGRSPDEEDASVMIIANMRRHGYFAGPMGFDVEWQKLVKESYLEATYAPTDEMLIS